MTLTKTLWSTYDLENLATRVVRPWCVDIFTIHVYSREYFMKNMVPHLMMNFVVAWSLIWWYLYIMGHRKAPSEYKCGTRHCDLCLSEKTSITMAERSSLLKDCWSCLTYRHRTKLRFHMVKKVKTENVCASSESIIRSDIYIWYICVTMYHSRYVNLYFNIIATETFFRYPLLCVAKVCCEKCNLSKQHFTNAIHLLKFNIIIYYRL